VALMRRASEKLDSTPSWEIDDGVGIDSDCCVVTMLISKVGVFEEDLPDLISRHNHSFLKRDRGKPTPKARAYYASQME